MKRICGLLALLCASVFASIGAHAQVLPNVSYNALLNSTCSSATSFCSGTAMPQGTGVSGLTGSALDVNSQNYAVATVTVSGTFTGATINFEFSDQTASTNYFSVLCTRTDSNIIEGSEAVPNSTTRAWQCPVIATTRFRVRVSGISTGALNAWITMTQIAIDPSPTAATVAANIAGSGDPCINPNVLKTSAVVNITTATTTQLVAISGTTSVYVCGFYGTQVVGTAATYTWEYGAGSTCGTGTTALSGAIIGGGFTPPTMAGMHTIAGQALCVLTGGTSPSMQGTLVYVQQ
jgi:hypothetical protein